MPLEDNMAQMKTGLVTCSLLPQLHPDDDLLRPALAHLGVETVPVDWQQPVPEGLQALLLRTPWNYHRQLGSFLDWVRAVEPLPMWNSPEVVRWNCHKGYLSELYEAGLPVVPTLTFEPGQALDPAYLKEWSAGQPVVAKPAVSAGSYRTSRYDAWGKQALEHLHSLMESEAAMLQPYYAKIEQHGERALIFIEGKFSHAVRRHLPLLEGAEVEYMMQPVSPSPEELAAAHQILEWLPFPDLLYARVDLIPDPDGRPVLLELELIEPQLFLRENPPAAACLARAFQKRLAGLPGYLGK